MSELLTAEFEEPLRLEGGGVLPRQTIAYTTRGRLAADGGNAILLCHSFTHDAVASGIGPDGRPGWWDKVVGPGKAIDTERFYVVCSNVLGGCGGSTGPASPAGDGRPWGSRFPLVTIPDMVDAQARLLDRLGIERLAAVAGGCMGAMQALELARRHPARVARVAAITIGAATSAHSLALWRVLRRLIESDPDFRGGNYYGGGPWPKQGLGMSNQVALLLWMGRQQMAERYGRRPAGEGGLRFTLGEDFAIEELLEKVHQSTSERFDPNSFLHLSRAMDYFDLERGHASLEAGLAGIAAEVLLVSYRGDWRYPPEETERLREALPAAGKAAEHLVLDSAFSHGAFLYDPISLLPPLRAFLERV